MHDCPLLFGSNVATDEAIQDIVLWDEPSIIPMSNTKKIKKVVIPVAGFGTRFLPATKAIPKEMLPIIDKPLIEYAVDEAVDAGIEEIIFITSHTKISIENHFDSNFELEENYLEIINRILSL